MDLTAELVALVESRTQVRSQTPPNIRTRNLTKWRVRCWPQVQSDLPTVWGRLHPIFCLRSGLSRRKQPFASPLLLSLAIPPTTLEDLPTPGVRVVISFHLHTGSASIA
jgi:hypothetical protein